MGDGLRQSARCGVAWRERGNRSGAMPKPPHRRRPSKPQKSPEEPHSADWWLRSDEQRRATVAKFLKQIRQDRAQVPGGRLVGPDRVAAIPGLQWGAYSALFAEHLSHSARPVGKRGELFDLILYKRPPKDAGAPSEREL